MRGRRQKQKGNESEEVRDAEGLYCIVQIRRQVSFAKKDNWQDSTHSKDDVANQNKPNPAAASHK